MHTNLANGIEAVINENNSSEAVSIQIWVNVGSLDENKTQRGMAHFCEHMLFKGTKLRKSGDIAREAEAIGGRINAYTSFEKTVYYITLPAEKISTAIDILSDAIWNSEFNPQEFEREKAVILEEVDRSLDDPSTLVMREVLKNSFANTEIAREILGTTDDVKSITRDSLYQFYKKWYQPQNMKVVISGGIKTKQVYKDLKIKFGRQENLKVTIKTEQMRQEINKPQISILHGDYKQPRLEVAFQTPLKDTDTAIALNMTAFALGAGETSRLKKSIRDEKQLAFDVSASVFYTSLGGLFLLSALCEVDKITSTLEEMVFTTLELAEKKPLLDNELTRAKNNLIAQKAYRNESVDGQAQSIGEALNSKYKLKYDEVFDKRISNITSGDVKNAVLDYLTTQKCIVSIMLPNNTELDKKSITAALENANKRIDSVAATKTVKHSNSTTQDNIVTVLDQGESSGIKIIYNHNKSSKIMSLTMAAAGGLRDENVDNCGIYNSSSSMLGLASSTEEFASFTGGLEDAAIHVAGFSGKDSFGLEIQCLESNAPIALSKAYDSFYNPVFPQDQWLSFRNEIKQQIKNENDSPANIAFRLFQEKIYGEHQYKNKVYGTETSFENYSLSDSLEHFKKKRDSSKWVIAASGSLKPTHFHKLILENIKSNANTKDNKYDNLNFDHVKKEELFVKKEREQTHIVYGFPGLAITDPDRYALNVLINILEGQGGRLFINLRDKESLAYTVSPISAFGCQGGLVGTYIATNPDKKDQALDSLKRELDIMKNTKPNEDEVKVAINNIAGSYILSFQSSDTKSTSMALMELYNLKYDFHKRYLERIKHITPQMVQDVAIRLFNDDKLVSVVVGS